MLKESQIALHDLATEHLMQSTIEVLNDEKIDNAEESLDENVIEIYEACNDYLTETGDYEELEETQDVPEEFSRQLDKTIVHLEHVRFKCNRCIYEFKTKKKLQKHQTIHDMSDNNICHICMIKFETENAFHNHNMTKHDPEKNLKCLICGINVKNSTSYKRHMRVTHNPNYTECKKVLCDLCGKELKNETSLQIHMRTHSEQKPFQVFKNDLK